jgi:hypothetical protein
MAADGILYKFHSALNEIDANMYLGIWLYIAGKLRGKIQATGLDTQALHCLRSFKRQYG